MGLELPILKVCSTTTLSSSAVASIMAYLQRNDSSPDGSSPWSTAVPFGTGDGFFQILTMERKGHRAMVNWIIYQMLCFFYIQVQYGYCGKPNQMFIFLNFANHHIVKLSHKRLQKSTKIFDSNHLKGPPKPQMRTLRT